MSDFDLKEARNKLVAKDNRIIQNSRMSLSLVEYKAILYLISKIKPDDEPGGIYVFNCKEFQALLKWNKEASYQNIKIMLQNLGDASCWIEGRINGRIKDILIRWFDIVHMDPGNGDIEISFHRDIFPFLVDLKKNLEVDKNYYTAYKLENVTLMKHKYSIKIYELLKSYQYNNKKWTFENGTGTELDLQRRIADTVRDKKTGKPISMIPASWANWAIFKRDVLDPAIKEINKYTDIKVAYSGKKEDIHHRRTRAIRTIEFYMVGKTVPEQRATEKIIDAEYIVTKSDEKYHQLSIEELFFKEHEKSLEKEKAEREYFEASQRKKEVDAVKHPLLFAELNEEPRKAGFDEKKINQLYSTAIKERVAGVIATTKWELFAVDLVTNYYDKIVATPEDTRTTIYQRLLDSIKNDYDYEVSGLIEQYKK